METTLNLAGSPDPILTAIQSFRDGLTAFNALPDSESPDDDKARIALTYGPPQDVLLAWDGAAQSHAGAVEALRLAVEENADFNGSDIADNMVKAALAYFDTQAARQSAA